MRTEFSGSAWKNPSVSTPVPSSSRTKPLTQRTLIESPTWESTYAYITQLMGAVPLFKGHHWSHAHITQYALTEVCVRLVTVNKFSTLYSFYVTQLQPKNSSEPFSPSHLHFTLLIKSPRLYAMIPFFKLRSAFVTLKGLSRDARPVRSCCVMEALAVTHLQTAASHILCSFFPWATYPARDAVPLTWRGKMLTGHWRTSLRNPSELPFTCDWSSDCFTILSLIFFSYNSGHNQLFYSSDHYDLSLPYKKICKFHNEDRISHR